jgi:hypothetical protein
LTERINPYAVTTAQNGELPFQPVHFHGVATHDDLRMTLRDSPLKKGWARVQPGISLAFISVAILLFASSYSDGDEPLPSIVWLVMGFVALPPWLAVARILTPGRRQQIERIKRMAAKQKPSWGWIDQEFVVICDENSVLRASWDFFAAPMIFPEHLMLPITSDANRRIILPWRFFGSVDDVRSLIPFLSEKQHALSQDPPQQEAIAELISQTTPPPARDTAQARNWDRDHWPFPSDPHDQFDFTIDTAAVMSTRRFATYSTLIALLILLWYFLPLLVAAAAWSIYEYRFFGSWDFLTERPFSSLLVLLPTGFALIYLSIMMLKAMFSSRQIQQQPVAIRIRRDGIHLSHQAFASWLRWPIVEAVIVEDDQAGWIVEETGDEVRFPRICFDTDESFEQFKARLQAVEHRDDEVPAQP